MNMSEANLPSNQKFGFFFSAVFGLAGMYLSSESNTNLSYVFFGLAGLFILMTIINSALLLPLNQMCPGSPP